MFTKVPYDTPKALTLVTWLIATVSVVIAVFGNPVAAIAAAAVARTLAQVALSMLGTGRDIDRRQPPGTSLDQ